MALVLLLGGRRSSTNVDVRRQMRQAKLAFTL
jgi:hypothetical protein